MAKDTPYDKLHFPPENGLYSARFSDSSPLATPSEEPLYTEIRIPLPRITPPFSTSEVTSPSPSPSPSPPRSRSHAHTLASSFSPFHRRRSSSLSAGTSTENPASTGLVMKSLMSRKKSAGSVDALAVIPAVLVLSAELFTPGEVERREDGKGG